jgi:cytochrome c-type biogenesis protein CcmH
MINKPAMRGLRLSAAAWVFLWAALSLAAETQENAAKAREIQDNLMAPCCWSQPVSEHDSEIAQQIRHEVDGMVAAGKSRQEILDSYIARYGERILVTPPAKGFNALAYILPWAALPLGAWILIMLLRRLRSPAPSPAPAPAAPPDSRFNSVIEREMRELDK